MCDKDKTKYLLHFSKPSLYCSINIMLLKVLQIISFLSCSTPILSVEIPQHSLFPPLPLLVKDTTVLSFDFSHFLLAFHSSPLSSTHVPISPSLTHPTSKAHVSPGAAPFLPIPHVAPSLSAPHNAQPSWSAPSTCVQTKLIPYYVCIQAQSTVRLPSPDPAPSTHVPTVPSLTHPTYKAYVSPRAASPLPIPHLAPSLSAPHTAQPSWSAPPPLAYKRTLPLILFVHKPRAPSAYPRLILPHPLTSPPCHHSLIPRTRLMSLLALRHPYLYLTSLHPYPHPTPRSHPGRPPPLAYKRTLPLIMFVHKPRVPSAYPRLIPQFPVGRGFSFCEKSEKIEFA